MALSDVFEAKKPFATVTGPVLGGNETTKMTLRTPEDAARFLKTHPRALGLLDAFVEKAVDSMSDPDAIDEKELVVFLKRYPVKSGFAVSDDEGSTFVVV